METISNLMKIKAIMEYYGLNQSEMAAKMGIHQANLSEILREKRACGPGIMTKLQITFPEVNTKWLYQEGNNNEPMILPNHPTFSGDITVTGNHNSHIGHGQHNMPAIIEVKENGVEVECPNCGEIIEVAETTLTLVPHEVMLQPDTNLAQFVKRNPEKLSTINLAQLFGNDTIAIEIDTRAMEPEFKEGHFLMIRKLPDLSYARADGTAYVVDAIRPHALLRYLTRERDGSYVLTAENEKRTPIYLKAEEIYGIWQIEGGFWKRR